MTDLFRNTETAVTITVSGVAAKMLVTAPRSSTAATSAGSFIATDMRDSYYCWQPQYWSYFHGAFQSGAETIQKSLIGNKGNDTISLASGRLVQR